MMSYLLFEQDEEEPKDESFSPDGGYIPRILFLGTEGVESPLTNTPGILDCTVTLSEQHAVSAW